MKPYFTRNQNDKQFYDRYIAPRIPDNIFDAHIHLNLPEHIEDLPEERLRSDWALECGHLLPVEDAYACASELFPGIEYFMAGFPLPAREADLQGNNKYLAKKKSEGAIAPFMCVRPEWPVDEVEEQLLSGSFVGFKPYPDMVSGVKGADISIYDFLPKDQWKILDRYKKAVMLHLPRKGRLADDDNVRELLEIRLGYPDVTIIVAHFGRSYTPFYLREGLKKLKGGEGFYFDTAAVVNPDVFRVAFDSIDHKFILYGSDMPMVLWHGRREWTEKSYTNLSSEDFSWNTDRRSPEVEKTYTFYLYEEVRSILDGAENRGLTKNQIADIFRSNALRALSLDSGRSHAE